HPPLSMVLDIQHGLYARVWPDVPEVASFCDSHSAHYRSKEEWHRILQEAGFQSEAVLDDRVKLKTGSALSTCKAAGQPLRLQNAMRSYTHLFSLPAASGSGEARPEKA